MVLANGTVVGKESKWSGEVPLPLGSLTVALKAYSAYTMQGGYGDERHSSENVNKPIQSHQDCLGVRDRSLDHACRGLVM